MHGIRFASQVYVFREIGTVLGIGMVFLRKFGAQVSGNGDGSLSIPVCEDWKGVRLGYVRGNRIGMVLWK